MVKRLYPMNNSKKEFRAVVISDRPQTLGNFQRLTRLIEREFFELNHDMVQCGRIRNNPFFNGHSIVISPPIEGKMEKEGWDIMTVSFGEDINY